MKGTMKYLISFMLLFTGPCATFGNGFLDGYSRSRGMGGIYNNKVPTFSTGNLKRTSCYKWSDGSKDCHEF